MGYEQIQSSRLYEEVAAQIRERIIKGELQPGDRLPTEQMLAQEFGVSRTVVREATQSLSAQGLVKVKHGKGIFVDEPSTDLISNTMAVALQVRGASVFDLHDVREILEVEMVGRAAERASEEDKNQLATALEWMERVLESPQEYIETDLLFHSLIAKATHNEIFVLLLEPLMDLLRQSRLKAIMVPGGVEKSFLRHQAILDCIEKGDSAEAKMMMHEHLKEVRERLSLIEEDKLF